jgi:hypothetical protein
LTGSTAAAVTNDDEGAGMKQSWAGFRVVVQCSALLGGALGMVFALAGCNDYGNTFQAPTGATIDFLSPAAASAGGSDNN